MEVKIIPDECQSHYLTRSVAQSLSKRKVKALPINNYKEGDTVEATEVLSGITYKLLLNPRGVKCANEGWSFQIVDLDEFDLACEEHDDQDTEHSVSIFRENILVQAEGSEEKMILEGCDRDDVSISFTRSPRRCERCDTLWLKVDYYGHDANHEECYLPVYISGRGYCEKCNCDCPTCLNCSTDEEDDSEGPLEVDMDSSIEVEYDGPVVQPGEPEEKKLRSDGAVDVHSTPQQ